MQKVERRRHRQKGRGRLTGLLLCLLLLAVCVTAAFLLHRKAVEKPPEARQRAAGAITRRNREDLESITLIPRDGEGWTAVMRTDGKLQLSAGDGDAKESWTVDETVGDRLLDAAANLTYEDVFTTNRAEWEEHADEFGLEKPLISLTIRFTDDTVVRARIGDSADPGHDAYYYMTVDGDDRLFAVSAGTVQDLSTEKALMHPVPKLPIYSVLLDRITVKNGDGSVRIEWALQGRVTDQDAAENWLVKVPYDYPADYDAVKNLKESTDNLRLNAYVEEATEEAKERYGLKEPAAMIELHMAAGSTGTVSQTGVYDVTEREEQTVELILGSSKNDMVDYVLYDGQVYTISHFSVSTFTDASPFDSLARYPVATPLNSLESVMVERDGEEPVHYAILRQEASAGDDGNEPETETTRCLRNGEEISWDTFAAAYERLLTVTMSGKLPDDYPCKPIQTKYTFRTVSGGTHTVELSDYDGIHDAVTVDGHTLFYLIKGGMTELP